MSKTRRLLVPSLFLLFAILACSLQGGSLPTSTPDSAATAAALTVAAQVSSLAATTPVSASQLPTAAVPTAIPIATTVPTATLVCDQAVFVSETVPDGTVFPTGAAFTKSWRLKNTGTCTWTTSYALVFVSGDPLNAPASNPLSGNVVPGQEVDLAVNMQAPGTPGSYTSNWELRNASGVLFGVGPGSSIFWAKITVVPPTATVASLHIPPILVPMPIVPLRTTQQVVNQVTAPASSIGHATIACPSGSVLTGGGFAGNTDLFVYNNSANGNDWQVYAQNSSASSQTLNAYAICLSGASGATSQQVLNQVTAPASGVGNAVVACPSGSVVTGGGYAGNANLFVYNSSEDGNGWQVYAQNSSASSQTLNAYAICVSGISGANSQQLLNQVTVPAGGYGQAASACPSGGLLTGGGFAGNTNLFVYNSSENDNGWQAFAQNPSASGQLLNAYAICLTFP